MNIHDYLDNAIKILKSWNYSDNITYNKDCNCLDYKTYSIFLESKESNVGESPNIIISYVPKFKLIEWIMSEDGQNIDDVTLCTDSGTIMEVLLEIKYFESLKQSQTISTLDFV